MRKYFLQQFFASSQRKRCLSWIRLRKGERLSISELCFFLYNAADGIRSSALCVCLGSKTKLLMANANLTGQNAQDRTKSHNCPSSLLRLSRHVRAQIFPHRTRVRVWALTERILSSNLCFRLTFFIVGAKDEALVLLLKCTAIMKSWPNKELS